MSEKQQASADDNTKPVSKLKKVLVLFAKLSFILLILLAFYTLYLDAKVVEKFEGQRWQVPVQVFGKVERFHIGDEINLSRLKDNLLLTGYRRTSAVKQPGDFAISKKRIIIYRRAFDFGAGVEAPDIVTIDVKSKGQTPVVSQLYLDNQVTDYVEIEPYLMGRIIPENKEDRVLIPLQSVPEKLLDTLLIVEDRDFYFHAGISPLGILRALYNNLKAGRTVQGGSTLTQQLVKNMYLTRDKTLWRKVNEAIMSLLLEYRYSKDQLLEAYINEVYLGQHFANGIYGFGLAAEFYFGENIAQLSNAQMATLIGVIKGPSYYDPWRYPERTKKRRDLVLKLMFNEEYISKDDYLLALKTPLDIRKSRRLAPTKQKFPAYLQLVKKELSDLLSPALQQSGIRVFTTFSVSEQIDLEKTVNKQLIELAKKNEHDLQVAMILTDIDSGEIKALVGDKKSGYAGFNRALNAKRPIGSLIKPAIYLAALERYQQYQLGTLLDDKALSFDLNDGEIWRPKNYDGEYRGQASIFTSLVKSLNIPTINLGMALGLDNVADIIHLLGYNDDITLRPSLLLGSINMSPYQVNQFYLPIANQGNHVQSHVVESVISAQGETIYQHIVEETPYFSAQASYLTDYMLTQVTQQGTAKSLTWRLKNKVVAGKTGTTNDQRDSWFVGYDGKHMVTTWLGRDDNKATDFTGSSGALTLFAEYIKKIGVTDKTAIEPTGIKLVPFDQETGQALSGACNNSIVYPVIYDGLILNDSCKQKKNEQAKELTWFEKLFGG
ncbi:penicillin-binding protein 1B [Colwellia sp. 1_MG-2023]|uniref:penicillin-binding protein 1B n=1 Tax=Colwellia sp. 1_MG-2023 TaxID=3062649 RepID=UPI0026E15F82|nr:penicillin-binding protein 1B [Colwellia sp. 1_MG-2023]MDO6444868.1 penicillin-binding protein 1B [Colwellia sp. 1_MG-2023]